MSTKKAAIENPSAQESLRKGGARGASKAPQHEGPAGKGEARVGSGDKWTKEARDSAGEKEPGKSRGPGG